MRTLPALRTVLLFLGMSVVWLDAYASGVDVPEMPCFDKYHQVYERNDGGYFVRQLRRNCAAMHIPLKGDPGAGTMERKQEHIEVFFDHGNERVIHETSEWIVNSIPEVNGCEAGIRQQKSILTTVFVDGVVRQSKSIDDLAAVGTGGSQPRSPYFTGGPHRARAAGDPFFNHRGLETIVGFKCERIDAKPPVIAAGSRMTVCALPLPASCNANGYIAPLHSFTSEGAEPWIEIKTLLLEVGDEVKAFDLRSVNSP
jgi:hypothetical protein